MTFDEYQAQTHRTNLYPEDKMLDCLALGLCSEAGEVADKVKKFYRGDMNTGLKLLLIAEISDCLWYLSELANYLNYPLGDIADYNLHKLAKRSENGRIRGSGDER